MCSYLAACGTLDAMHLAAARDKVVWICFFPFLYILGSGHNMFIVCMLPNDLALLHGTSNQPLVVRLTLCFASTRGSLQPRFLLWCFPYRLYISSHLSWAPIQTIMPMFVFPCLNSNSPKFPFLFLFPIMGFYIRCLLCFR